ncbi:MAG TPA: hypothetical protein VJ011_05790 [Steroidobacteraceae bacterium]|nr:hypothetical protein [Steroidobacteraceae bacterium]
MRIAVLARDGDASTRRRKSVRHAAASMSGNRNAGRPKRKKSASAIHAPIGPMRLLTAVEPLANEKPGSSGL